MGEEALIKLAGATVMVVGLGGVGSWCTEMLCRAGVGHLILIDGDTVDSTNRNRQLPALAGTVGLSKVAVRVIATSLKWLNPVTLVVCAGQPFDICHTASICHAQDRCHAVIILPY
jgi:tRNA threonylcarbamoyladenosine dehydratase